MNPLAWGFLVGAILLEVGGTLSLRMAVKSHPVWYVAVAVGYISSFAMFVGVLENHMPLGVAYGIWSAAGVAITAVCGKFLFKEPFTWLMGLGVVLVMFGVLLVEMGAPH
ncbi:MAG: QacE family quaternary ammonium compound efflux SMR transporter [Microbacteriaceae bacterium]|nr:QacE family quaternary ammonium compound efflux SMR transporter [Cryobacterium sp.]MBX3103805.1 QacE family quaternary ammonium compound efflux SMR transporter [Cryobacterium sp.]MCC6377036.1 QacE family quaternary ammonium compound efflux SMR transporter [Microbacteriaceae bacterium]